jgi:hypothetical protein
MQIKRTTRSLTAWIALFAILLGAVAPALSHALSRFGDGGQRWVEVCTVAGTKLVAVPGASDEGQAGDVDVFPAERCPFCSTHGGAPALPAFPVMPFVLKGGADDFPLLYFHAPRPLFVWAAAHPRAPPVLS